MDVSRQYQTLNMKNPKWTREELILALDLYFRCPPLKTNKDNPEIIALSDLLNSLTIHPQKVEYKKFRNPNGVYMKLCNFLRFEVGYSGVGLKAGGKLEEEIWNEFSSFKSELKNAVQVIINNASVVPKQEEEKVKQKDEGQVFTVAKLHYINGVVYFTAHKGITNIQTLADNYAETTKSGKVKHPLDRVRTLTRLAQGIGLITIYKDRSVEITNLGKLYYNARANDKWSLSKSQQQILCDYILSDYYRTKTIYSITTLFRLYKNGYVGMELARQFAIEIGKDKAWKSDVTYEGFTKFGLSYIEELGLLEMDDRDLLFEDISNERKYQQSVNEVDPIQIPKGNLPRPKPRKYGNRKRYVSNPRRSRSALEIAGFQCELNKSHTTFINKKSKKQYMEAHHLIPMGKQGDFEFDIDVPENIMSLCPNCHKEIHLSEDISKRDILIEAYESKKNQLPERGIDIDLTCLFEIYGISG
jgi:predicted HNH restriction endonuclease